VPFGVEVYCVGEQDLFKGVVECRIHADNLTEPVALRVPVRIAIKHGDAYQVAKQLVRERVGVGSSVSG